MNKPEIQSLNVSHPKTIETFNPGDIVFTCVGKFQLGEFPGWEMMWKAAFRTEEDLRKTCFWFGGHGWVESPTIEPPTILRLTADEFVRRSYKEDPNGMNPFEALNRLEFITKWNIKATDNESTRQ